MNKKILSFKKGRYVYKLCPESPSENDTGKKWYFHCINDRTAPRIYGLPNEKTGFLLSIQNVLILLRE